MLPGPPSRNGPAPVVNRRRRSRRCGCRYRRRHSGRASRTWQPARQFPDGRRCVDPRRRPARSDRRRRCAVRSRSGRRRAKVEARRCACPDRVVIRLPGFIGKRQHARLRLENRAGAGAPLLGSEIELAPVVPACAAVGRGREQIAHFQHAGSFRMDERKLRIRPVDPDERTGQNARRQLGEIAGIHVAFDTVEHMGQTRMDHLPIPAVRGSP